MKTGSFRLVVLTAALLSLLSKGEPGSAQAGTTYFVTDVDASTFPNVTFRLRALDLNNRVVAGLSNANLAVYENGEQVPAENVQVTPHDDGPITFLFLIDHGRLANFSEFGTQNIRQVFSVLVDSGIFVNDRDQLEVMVRENINTDRTEPRLGPTQQGADLRTWLANYPFERRSQNSTKGLEGVADAITEMGKLVPVPGSQAAVIVLVSRYIEDPARSVAIVAAQNQANQAKSDFISIYAFSTDVGQANKEPLEILAEISNGRYTALQRSTAGALAEDAYREINIQRLYYTISYQSIQGNTGPRVITANSRDVPTVGVSGNYQVSPQPAAVTLVEPEADSVIRREAVLDSEGTPVYSPNTLKVVANVSFPDGFPRSLRSAELLVNGASQATASPSPGAAQAEFEADLSQFSTVGTNPVTLEVRLVDSLGLESSAQTSVVVEVAPPPGRPGLLLALGGLGVVGLICGSALVLIAVGGGVYLLRRRAPQRAAPAAGPVPAEPMHTLLAGRALKDQLLATLTVLVGPKGVIGEAINIVKPTTVIGRNPQATDIHFYADVESSVSRVHCTIQKDGEVFKLTDNGSSAGTRLNGRALPPNDPVVLADNDEIVLGDLGRLGVKMRFNPVAEPGELKFSGSADDRTRIMEEPPPDDDHSASYVG